MADPRALVVGAGPVGLAAAAELARHGVAVRIVDQAGAPSSHSKALGVHARTLEAFDDMGIAARAVERGRKLHGTNAYADGRRIVHAGFDQLDSPYPFLLCLPQSETERLLTEHLESLGVRVERGLRLTALSQDEEAVEATLVDGAGAERRARVPWLIGCDGAHSTVRHALGLPFDGVQYEEPFVLGDLDLDWSLPDDEVHAFLAPDGVLACFPLPTDGRWRVVGDGALSTDPPTPEELNDLIVRRGGPKAVLRGAHWTTGFRIDRRMIPRYRVARVLLAGDAAHIHSPVGGQGMNTGIQDGYNLAWKLALVDAGAARPELLDSYHVERHPVAAGALSGSDLATRALTLRNPVAREVRDRVVSVLAGLEVLQRRVLADASAVGVSYRKSPIVGEHRAPLLAARVSHAATDERPSVSDWIDFGAAPHPGDRAPDVTITEGVRLFDLLRGTVHVLLLFDGGAPTADGYRYLAIAADRARHYARGRLRAHIVVPSERPPSELSSDPRVLLDPEGALHRRFGASAECLYLIRPDGYVAFRAQPADDQALVAYLAKIFL